MATGVSRRASRGRVSEQGQGARGFWHPRYWPTWLLIGWLRAVALLPLPWSVKLHKVLGRCLRPLVGRRRSRKLAAVLAASFPTLSEAERAALERQVFESLVASIAELAAAWFGRIERLSPIFRIEGAEHLETALAKGRGVIVFSGHFTPLELCARMVKTLVPHFAFMYSPRKNPLLNEFQIRGRKRAAHVSFPSDDVRSMLRTLADNGVVWYAPDQTQGKSDECVQLFGQPVTMSNATSRVARISGAAVVPFFFCRSDDDSSYLLRFEAPLSSFPSDDAAGDTQKLTSILERFIAECPAQYLWNPKKFLDLDRAPPEPAEASAEQSTRLRVLRTVAAIIAVPLFITAFDNTALWSAMLSATSLDEHRFAILASMLAIQGGSLVLLLALVPTRFLFKAFACMLLVVAAICGYFMSSYGTLIDQTMIRNVAETSLHESAPLITGGFLFHVLVFGIVPSLIVALLPLGKHSWLQGFAARSALVMLVVVGVTGTVYSNYGPMSFFAHQHREVRLFLNPAYPIYAYLDYLFRSDDAVPAEREPLQARVSDAAGKEARKTLLVFVMGETARADHFAYNGYGRNTNAYTESYALTNYGDVTACGTSTADSVPCVFSKLGRKQFTHAAAARNETIFGALERLGVNVLWRDNSTGCKDVCDEAHFEQYVTADDAEFCDPTGCFDEVLLKRLDAVVSDSTRDQFIVFHERGSHGPAYYTDVPAQLKQYFPECDEAVLRNCSTAEINNAYDNTILYTDYVLARLIEKLLELSDRFDVAMLYVSDHGESLGENGLYLHGFPYQLAPAEQLKVPMLFWASRSFFEHKALDPACLQATADSPVSHDSIFHTLLPLFGIDSPEYRADLDVFARCRIPASTERVSQSRD